MEWRTSSNLALKVKEELDTYMHVHVIKEDNVMSWKIVLVSYETLMYDTSEELDTYMHVHVIKEDNVMS